MNLLITSRRLADQPYPTTEQTPVEEGATALLLERYFQHLTQPYAPSGELQSVHWLSDGRYGFVVRSSHATLEHWLEFATD